MLSAIPRRCIIDGAAVGEEIGLPPARAATRVLVCRACRQTPPMNTPSTRVEGTAGGPDRNARVLRLTSILGQVILLRSPLVGFSGLGTRTRG
jgi:hypothetical protein